MAKPIRSVKRGVESWENGNFFAVQFIPLFLTHANAPSNITGRAKNLEIWRKVSTYGGEKNLRMVNSTTLDT